MGDPSTDLTGVLAERYEILQELGQGGMATVYLARDLRDESRVAVKVLRPELAAFYGGDRFAREIRITTRLQHPGILPVLDSGEVEGRPFFVMPYVEGGTLAERLERDRQLAIEEALEISGEVADALEYAHRQGFVHRDIKPSNILLSRGHALLADFGIARALEAEGGEKLTETGVAVGTAAYMSPEQAAAGKVDARADIYSLGCLLYEMLAGQPPFVGATPQAVRARHSADTVPSLRVVRSTVSPSLEQAILKAMAKVPADRHASAALFKAAMRNRDPVLSLAPGYRRTIRLAALVLAVIATTALAWFLASPGGRALDRHRILVYPLVVPGDYTGPRTIGEDVATMIGSALDGAGPLRWIDGWPLLDPARRENIRSLTHSEALALARSRGCAYYLTGRLVVRGDSTEVFLQLQDARGDSIVARGAAGGLVSDAWRLGLRAVNGVLPTLIPAGAVDLVAEWNDRNPAAIASFLQGEAAFRRVHLTEALEHYRDAVKSDSSFGLAAIRGAQAATWNHHASEATSLIQIAIGQQLSPRYTYFARGYQAYLRGLADSAAVEFHRALDIDPEMAVAWMQLGEVYTHLLPLAGRPDSLAEAAFEEAHRLDPQATNLLLHLIELRLRRGETRQAQPLIRQFLAADPDTVLAEQVRIMDACVRQGPASEDWRKRVPSDAFALLVAANVLKGAGAQLPCALRMFRAVLQTDTGTVEGETRRWYALVGLQGVLVAQGRVAEARAELDAAIAAGLGGKSLYLVTAPLVPPFGDRAAEIARLDAAEWGVHYQKCPFPDRLWSLGLWEAHTGRWDVVAAIARDLEARGRQNESIHNRLGARAMLAEQALGRADTAVALGLFDELLSEGVPGDVLTWDPLAPRGSERLELARLLLSHGEPGRAMDVASVFDSAWPLSYTMYLPESLRLRAEAAARLGDRELESRFRARLAALVDARAVAVR
jgi:tetratricopeptide (TPR) repeat protein